MTMWINVRQPWRKKGDELIYESVEIAPTRKGHRTRVGHKYAKYLLTVCNYHYDVAKIYMNAWNFYNNPRLSMQEIYEILDYQVAGLTHEHRSYGVDSNNPPREPSYDHCKKMRNKVRELFLKYHRTRTLGLGE